MKATIIVSLALFGLMLVTGCTQVEEQINMNITAHDAFTLLEKNKNNPNFLFLDVRTPEEFSQEHIVGALNIDFRAEGFNDLISALDRQKTYLIYCGSGKRGGETLAIMKELRFNEVYNIAGGLAECQDTGFDIVTS